ncbi:type II CAAX prenyl endopeptidase Rce1 family protein [Patescibacteria group bacterium]
MKKLSLSIKIYIGLIVALAILAAISVFIPTPSFLTGTQELPASKPILALVSACAILIIYGGLGFIGLKLSQKLGFANIWDSKISNKQRFLIPAIIGCGIGILFILIDLLFRKFFTFGPIPHPQFPYSIIASLSAGIGEEIIFRLFFISFWVWIISHILFKRKWQNHVFWIISIFSALAFAFGHIPAVMIIFNFTTFAEIPTSLLSEIIILNSLVSLPAAYYFKKYGFLAAIGIHFWTDIVWHVVWGIF